MKRCMDVEIGGGGTGADLETIRRRGFEEEDLKLMGVEEEEAEDKDYWRFILDCMRFMRTCDVQGCHEASALVTCGVCH